MTTKARPVTTMNTIGGRIRQKLVEKGISQAELARRCGMKQQSLSYLCAADSPAESSRYTLKLSQELGVNPAWLQMGLGDPYDPVVKVSTPMGEAANMKKVPYVKCPDAAAHANGETVTPIAILMTALDCGPLVFAVAVSDESMSPVFRIGDHAIVDPDVAPRPADYVVATFDREVILRKYRARGSDYELVPLNEDWPTLLADDNIKILGVAVEWRSYRPRSDFLAGRSYMQQTLL